MAATTSGESVYNLIPPEVYEPPPPARHISVFASPTRDAWMKKTLVGRGEAERTREVAGGVVQVRHEPFRGKATMGDVKSPLRGTRNFLRSHEKEPRLAPPRKFSYGDGKGAGSRDCKPGVPRNGVDVPVQGLVSGKNFITSNAVEAILRVPKRPRDETVDYRTKKDYGKVPEYLTRVKAEVDDEYRYISSLRGEVVPVDQDRVRMLTEEERLDLLDGLKSNWERINTEYQKTSVSIDSPSKKRRKEDYEGEMEQIERDIEALSKKFIFVRVDDTNF